MGYANLRTTRLDVQFKLFVEFVVVFRKQRAVNSKVVKSPNVILSTNLNFDTSRMLCCKNGVSRTPYNPEVASVGVHERA